MRIDGKTITGKNRRLRRQHPVQLPICPTKIPHVLSRARASAVRGRLLRRSKDRHVQIARISISCVLDSMCTQMSASATRRHSCSNGGPSRSHFSELNEIKELIMFVRNLNENCRHVLFQCM